MASMAYLDMMPHRNAITATMITAKRVLGCSQSQTVVSIVAVGGEGLPRAGAFLRDDGRRELREAHLVYPSAERDN